ncbi:MAG TPA: hypothetical protein VJ800_11305 [Pseudolabrys sp.]|jgi:hypothetical protein|nr:hypothetical protein [Pseudolabrys sp.]
MFRKIALALGATTVIAAAALSPTTASAKWFHHGHHGHGHGHGHWGGISVGLIAPAAVLAADCYVVKKIVYTSVGPVVRRVTVCN